MRIFTTAVMPAIAAALYAGCSGGNQAAQTRSIPIGAAQTQNSVASSNPMAEATPLPAGNSKPASPGWLAPRAHGNTSVPLLYVSVEGSNEVFIYDEFAYDQSPIGKISAGVKTPWGLYVDKAGGLYVANAGTVTVYPAGSIYPSLTYSKDLCRPFYSMVDGEGNVFIANGRSCGSNNATVVEFPPGSTTPSQILQTPGVEVDGIDIDPQGNLDVAYRKRGLGSIERFAPGSSQGQILGMKVHQPQGLIVDNNGNIIVVDTSAKTRCLEVFAAGKLRPHVRLRLPDSGDPNQIAMTQDQSKIFVASFNNGTVYATGYPITKASTWTEVESLGYGNDVQGVALSNGQVF